MALISIDSINLEIEGTSKNEVLTELAKIAYKVGKVSNEEGFYKDLVAREEEVTTGFGFGFAVPHAKSSHAKEVGVLFGRSKNQIEWEALDDEPVNTFICLITPKEGAEEHLKLLAKISRKLMHEEFINTLRTGNKEEVLQAINAVIEA